MRPSVLRSLPLLACLLGVAGPCTSASAAGDTMRGGAALRAALTPPDQQFAIGGTAMQVAEGVAKTYWNADACGGQVTVEWTDQSQTINAVSTWKNPTDGYNNPGQNFDCTVDFNRDLSYDWPRFCTVLVHEFGHLTGHQHSPDPNDVMAPYYNHPIAQCQAVADPTAPPPAPAAPAPAPAPPVVETPAASATPAAPAAEPLAARVARVKPAVKHRTKAKHAKAKRRRAARHRRTHHRRHHRSHVRKARSSVATTATFCPPGSTDASYCEAAPPRPKSRRARTRRA